MNLAALLALAQAAGMIVNQITAAKAALSSDDQAVLDGELLKIHGKLDSDIDRTLAKLDAAAKA